MLILETENNWSQYFSATILWIKIKIPGLITFEKLAFNIVQYSWKSDSLSQYYRELVAQSAGAVEHADCISMRGKTPPASVLDMTRNNLMVSLQ